MDDKPTTRIVSIGELGGGTSYFSKDNAIGLYSWLRDRISEGKAPDMIVFHGEALPEISQFVTRAGRSKNLILTDFISDSDEAVVAVKPHLSRITDLLKRTHQHTNITYVMGPSDFRNIDREYDLVATIFRYEPKQIVESRDSYREKIEGVEKIIDNIEVSKRNRKREMKLLEEKLDKAAGRKAGEQELSKLKKGVENYRKSIGYLDEKLSEKREELEDYKHIFNLYTGLFGLWARTSEPMDIDKLIKVFGEKMDYDLYQSYIGARGASGKSITEIQSEAKDALEKVKGALSKLDADQDKEKFNRLESIAKNLADLTTKYAHTKISEVKRQAEVQRQSKMELQYKFTHNIPGTPELTRLADEIAKATIITSIKDAFGRRVNINIVSDNSDTLNVNGIRVTVANKASNSSQNFTAKPDNPAKSLLRGKEPTGAIDIMISARSPSSTVRIAPSENLSDHAVYSLTSAPFVDTDKLKEAWNSKIKTWFTDVAAKGEPSSGFDELVISGSKVDHHFYTSQALKMLADKEKVAQAKVLAKEIRAMTPNPAALGSPMENKDLLQVEGKMPSELRGKLLLQRMLVNLGVDVNNAQLRKELAQHVEYMDFRNSRPELSRALEWLSGYLSTEDHDKRIKTTDFLLLTDVHIGSPAGGYPSKQLLGAMSRYVADNVKTPFVLAMLGDNIEGQLRQHKNEHYNDSNQTNEYAFREFLKKKGMQEGSTEFNANVNEYKAWLADKAPMHHPMRQAEVFVEEAMPMIKKADLHVIVSGNHFNKSWPNKEFDEAEFLQPLVKPHLSKEKQDRMRIFPGGDWGFGTLELSDGLKVRMAHKTDPRIELDKLMGSQMVTLGGHIHTHTVTIEGNRAVITGTMQQGITNYPNTIGIPVSEQLRGMSTFSVTYSGNDKPLVYSDSFISLKELMEKGYVKYNPLIAEFEASTSATRTKIRQKTKI